MENLSFLRFRNPHRRNVLKCFKYLSNNNNKKNAQNFQYSHRRIAGARTTVTQTMTLSGEIDPVTGRIKTEYGHIDPETG